LPTRNAALRCSAERHPADLDDAGYLARRVDALRFEGRARSLTRAPAATSAT